MIAFTPWPRELAARYRAAGYWTDTPLHSVVSRHLHDLQAAARTAVICGARAFSYAALDAAATRLAMALQRRGLRQGDTALVQLPNVAEFYITLLALLKIGVAPVNALYSHQRLELLAYARQLQPRLLIAAQSHRLFAGAGFIEELRAVSPTLECVALLGESSRAAAFATPLQDLIDEPAQADPGPTSAAGEVAFFQLSGGSTGTPKLIPRTHNDYLYSVRCSAELCGLTSATRYLCSLPAAHNYPLSSPGALGVFHAGGCVVLAPDPEPTRCFDLIARHGVTMAALVPSAVALWLQAAPGHREKLRSLQLLQVGGASFAEAQARAVPAVLGCRLQQVFGMAEGLVNYTRLDDPDERVFRTQGRPMSPADEIRVVDEDGVPVPDGTPGQLRTRGPYTFRGYYAADEHNARVFDAEGFYASGDLVQRDADGYLRVVGRVKDQINRGGEKIAAEEIEHLLLAHPQIRAVALVSMPDALLGEKSCACIVSDDADLRLPQLRRHLRELGVAEYKLPDRVQHLVALPLTAVGKPDKQRLRAQLSNAGETP